MILFRFRAIRTPDKFIPTVRGTTPISVRAISKGAGTIPTVAGVIPTRIGAIPTLIGTDQRLIGTVPGRQYFVP